MKRPRTALHRPVSRIIATLLVMSTMLVYGTALAQDQPTISIWLEVTEGADTNQCVIDNIITPFNERGGVQVEATLQPNTWTATQTALAGGAGPDIVFTPGPTFALELARAGQVISLEDYAGQYGWADTFLPWGLDLGRVDGELYSISSEVETLILYYNADLFDEYGWEPPTTMDELVTLADEINEAGIIPFAHTNAEWRPANEWFVGEFLNQGAGPENVYRALTGELPWTDQVFVDALTPLVDFQQQGYFGGSLDRYYTTASADASASLAYGDAAMKIEGSWWISDANLFFEESGMTWDWVPVPSATGEANFTLGIGSTYSINATSENPDAAAEYLDYYFSPEIQAQIKVECGLDPAPVELEADQLEGLDEREAELLEQFGDATAAGDYGYTTWTFFPPRTQVYLYEEIERVWAGDLTIEEYLAGAQAIFEEDLANDNIPPLPER